MPSILSGTLSTALSGLRAQSSKIDNAANNIANATTNGAVADENTPESNVFIPNDVNFETQSGGGVTVDISPRENPTSITYSPQSPFANERGEIATPNISLEQEIVDVKIAEIAYKANAKVLSVADDLTQELIDTLA